MVLQAKKEKLNFQVPYDLQNTNYEYQNLIPTYDLLQSPGSAPTCITTSSNHCFEAPPCLLCIARTASASDQSHFYAFMHFEQSEMKLQLQITVLIREWVPAVATLRAIAVATKPPAPH